MLPISGYFGRKLRQDPFNLLVLFDKQLTKLIVGLNRLHRFDKKRAAARRHIMDHTGDGVFIFTPDRNHIAVSAQGNDRLS